MGLCTCKNVWVISPPKLFPDIVIDSVIINSSHLDTTSHVYRLSTLLAQSLLYTQQDTDLILPQVYNIIEGQFVTFSSNLIVAVHSGGMNVYVLFNTWSD